MKFLKHTFALLILSSSMIFAQEASESTFEVSGSVDAYFRSGDYAPYTSFANLNGFAHGIRCHRVLSIHYTNHDIE